MNKRTLSRYLIAPCLGLLLLSPIGATAKSDQALATLSATDRIAAGQHPVLLNVAQNQIETTIELGRVASAANGGGLLGALIINANDDRREIMQQSLRQKAEATAAPLRKALDGFDVDALALAATKNALSKVGGFESVAITVGKASQRNGQPEFLASIAATPSLFVNYRYELSPDFTQIRLIAEIVVARRGPNQLPQILYQQKISSISVLATRSFEPSENVVQWSAEGGKLAKAALTRAFAQLEELVPYALQLRPADAAAIAKNRDKVFAGGFYGPPILRKDGPPPEVVLWSGGFIDVQDIR